MFFMILMASLSSSFTVCLFPPFYPKIAELKGSSATEYGVIIGINFLVSFSSNSFLNKCEKIEMIQHLLTVFIHHCTIFLITCVFQNLDVISEVCSSESSSESSQYHHFLPSHSLNVSLPLTLHQMLLFQSQ